MQQKGRPKSDDLAFLLFSFAPPFSVEHGLVRFFACCPQCIISLFSFLADRSERFNDILGQAVIPTLKPVLAIGMQFFPTAFPKPLFQCPAPDNVHKIVTFRAKRTVPDLPASDPSLHQKVVHKILGPMDWVGKIKNFVSLGNQNPAGVFFPCHLLFFKPSSPDKDGVLVGVKNIPELSANTRTRSHERQSLKLLGEFHTRNPPESSHHQLFFKTRDVLGTRQTLFGQLESPFLSLF